MVLQMGWYACRVILSHVVSLERGNPQEFISATCGVRIYLRHHGNGTLSNRARTPSKHFYRPFGKILIKWRIWKWFFLHITPGYREPIFDTGTTVYPWPILAHPQVSGSRGGGPGGQDPHPCDFAPSPCHKTGIMLIFEV